MDSRKSDSSGNIAWALLVIFFLVPKMLDAQYSRNELKAVFLEKIALFIEWPAESAAGNPMNPLVIGVINDKPFSTALKKIYRNRKIKDREVRIKYFPNADAIRNCDILFVSKSRKDGIASILSRTNGSPILTISDTEALAKAGIHIAFFIKEDKLKFAINLNAMRKSGVKANYHLLQLAKIIDSEADDR